MSLKGRKRWTADEDQMLLEGFQLQVNEPTGKGQTINWSEVAKNLPGRSNKDCRKRYVNEIAGNLKKGPWSKEEDSQLKRLITRHGLAWVEIAQGMKTRGADQCSKRWHHSLNPELDRRVWTEDESETLLQALALHGSRWKEIQKIHFPMRSANNIKNQSTILARRKARLPSPKGPCCVEGVISSPLSLTSTDASSPESLMTVSDTHSSQQDATEPSAFGIEWSSEELHLEEDAMFATYLNNLRSSASSNAEDDFLGTTGLLTPDSVERLPILICGENESGSIEPSTLNAADMEGLTHTGSLHGRGKTHVSEAITEDTACRQTHMDWRLEQVMHARASPREEAGVSLYDDVPALAATVLGLHQGQQDMARVSDKPAALNSRMTIVIDGATPETLNEVMGILIRSPAKVEFQFSNDLQYLEALKKRYIDNQRQARQAQGRKDDRDIEEQVI